MEYFDVRSADSFYTSQPAVDANSSFGCRQSPNGFNEPKSTEVDLSDGVPSVCQQRSDVQIQPPGATELFQSVGAMKQNGEPERGGSSSSNWSTSTGSPPPPLSGDSVKQRSPATMKWINEPGRLSASKVFKYDELIDVFASASAPGAAAAAAATSVTRCSCNVGCPCHGRCVVSTSFLSDSVGQSTGTEIIDAQPLSSAFTDIDSFISRFTVPAPPPYASSFSHGALESGSHWGGGTVAAAGAEVTSVMSMEDFRSFQSAAECYAKTDSKVVDPANRNELQSRWICDVTDVRQTSTATFAENRDGVNQSCAPVDGLLTLNDLPPPVFDGDVGACSTVTDSDQLYSLNFEYNKQQLICTDVSSDIGSTSTAAPVVNISSNRVNCNSEASNGRNNSPTATDFGSTSQLLARSAWSEAHIAASAAETAAYDETSSAICVGSYGPPLASMPPPSDVVMSSFKSISERDNVVDPAAAMTTRISNSSSVQHKHCLRVASDEDSSGYLSDSAASSTNHRAAASTKKLFEVSSSLEAILARRKTANNDDGGGVTAAPEVISARSEMENLKMRTQHVSQQRPRAPPPAPPTRSSASSRRSSVESLPTCDQFAGPTAHHSRSLAGSNASSPPSTTLSPAGEDDNSQSPLSATGNVDEKTSSSQVAEMQAVFLDKISLCQRQRDVIDDDDATWNRPMTTNSFRKVHASSTCSLNAVGRDGGGGSPATPRRALHGPQPPRRGCSMSPMMRTKSLRGIPSSLQQQQRQQQTGSEASKKNAAVGENDAKVVGSAFGNVAADLDNRRGGSCSAPGNGLEQTTLLNNVVPGQKPIAQIRPNAIRSPSVSSYIGSSYSRQGSDEKHSPPHIETTRDDDSCQQQFDAINVNPAACGSISNLNIIGGNGRGAGIVGNSSTTNSSRFGTLRSRIRDYVAAATGSATPNNRGSGRQNSCSSTSYRDWTLPRNRTAVTRSSTLPRIRNAVTRSSSVTSWEPDRSDYVSCSAVHVDPVDTGPSSRLSSSYITFAAPRPYATPRPLATSVALPQNVSVDAADEDRAVAAASAGSCDVASSISSRISTFLTFLGGSKPRPSSNPVSSTAPSNVAISAASTVQSLTSSGSQEEDLRAAKSAAIVTERRRTLAPVTSAPSSDEPNLKQESVNGDVTSRPEPSSMILQRKSSNSSLMADPVRSVQISSDVTAETEMNSTAQSFRRRQPMRFTREMRSSMSTFRSSGSINVDADRNPADSSGTADGYSDVVSDADRYRTLASRPSSSRRRVSDDYYGTLRGHQSSTASSKFSVSKYIHQSAPATPADSPLLSYLPVSSSHEGNDKKDEAENSGRNGHEVSSSFTANEMEGAVRKQQDPGHRPEVIKIAVVSLRDSSGRTLTLPAAPASAFKKVDVEVEKLIEQLVIQNSSPPSSSSSLSSELIRSAVAADVQESRDALLTLARRFVADCQRLVSSATRSTDQLVASLDPSLTTLAAIVRQSRRTADAMTPPSQGIILVGRVRDLAQAYRATVVAAARAVGRPLNGGEMKALMQQATSLAALLSSLIRMLNRVDA